MAAPEHYLMLQAPLDPVDRHLLPSELSNSYYVLIESLHELFHFYHASAQHRQRRSSSNVRAQSAMGQQPFAAGTGATTHPSSLLPLSPGSRGFYPITPNPYTYLPRPPPGHQRVLADGQYFEYNPNEQVITDPGPTHFVEVAYAPWSSSFHTSNSTSFSPPFNAFSYARTPSPPPPTNYREGNSWFSPAKFKVKSRRDENSDKNDNLSVSVKKLSTSEAKN